MTSGLTRATGIAPIAMSAAALALVIGQIAMAGAARQADEGAAAHLWQMLMVLQIPVIAAFAIASFPRSPRFTTAVVAVQIVAALSAAAPVLLLGW